MTDTIEQKALALIAEIRTEQGTPAPDYLTMRAALIRAIEQHEAFRREVSDAVKAYMADPQSVTGQATMRHIHRFIIAKPDPLVEVLQEISGEGGYDNFDHYAYRLRAALAARGLEVRKIGEGE